MNITLTGNLGSGKSSVCKELKEMGYEITSTGTIFRSIAEEKGITVVELNELAKKDRSIDDMIDARSTELGKKLDNTIFDSRMAWNFVGDSFKVFLLVNLKESARRVFNDKERSSESYNSVEEAAENLKKRALLEQARFKELYDVNYYHYSNFNLVIESTSATPREIAEEMIRNFESYKRGEFTSKLLLNTQTMQELGKDVSSDTSFVEVTLAKGEANSVSPEELVDYMIELA